MNKKRRNKPVATGIISDCDVCGGFMFNAKRYMHMNDAYFTRDQVMFPYEAKKIFDRIVHEHHYLNSPQYMIYLLDKLVAWLDGERTNPVKKCTIVTTL